jgi:hypothetical protein
VPEHDASPGEHANPLQSDVISEDEPQPPAALARFDRRGVLIDDEALRDGGLATEHVDGADLQSERAWAVDQRPCGVYSRIRPRSRKPTEA